MKNNGIAKESLIREMVVRDKQGRLVEIKRLTLYADLLTAIHGEGVKSITTEIVQLPADANKHLAVVKAIVQTGMGTFTGLGDALPESVELEFIPHLLRVAETRAKARALRDALGIGVVAFEELSGELTGIVPEPSAKTPNEPEPPKAVHTPAQPQQQQVLLMTENQRRMLFRQLQERGIEGENARNHLLKAFNVGNLKDVTRKAASDMIQSLTNGGNGAGQEASHA